MTTPAPAADTAQDDDLVYKLKFTFRVPRHAGWPLFQEISAISDRFDTELFLRGRSWLNSRMKVEIAHPDEAVVNAAREEIGLAIAYHLS